MSDDGRREIQLNGKQLVFLFMAGTVAAVVIFLCGVLVGRGAPIQRATSAGDAPERSAVDPTFAVQMEPRAVETGTTTPITAGETLTYPDHLESTRPPDETLRPASETGDPSVLDAGDDRAPVRPASRDVPLTRSTAGARRSDVRAAEEPGIDAVLSEPLGTGYVVQVAAVTQLPEAEMIARRLGTKGYPAFVTTAGASVFRVRVGKYTNRTDAETVADRLEREEQFKPWITR